jgi:LytS/YehU family sensor histidine kinase
MASVISGNITEPYEIQVATLRCTSGVIAITSCAVIIKIMKDYFFRQRENDALATENIINKLRLLKMQMHPNILFECLNSICNDIDAGTIHAPEMILKLSELLSYLLYEAELKQVPLIKEVKMMQTYIELKELEYKNTLNINFNTSGDMSTYCITPVIFLPLLETIITPVEKMQKPSYVTVELKAIASTLYFSLKTNIPGMQIKMPSVLATLDGIKRRLQISQLYRFKIKSQTTSNNFTIVLQLEPDSYFKNHEILNEDALIYEYK